MSVAIRVNFRKQLSQKELQLNRRIPYTEIKKETGTPIKTISDWDKGDVKQFHAGVLERFCHYFNCSVGDLLEYVPDGNRHK